MGRIVTPILIANAMDPTKQIRCDALVAVILEQSRAAVDMVGHRLVQVKYVDLK
ncbi:MAG: hypothetical protein HY721_31470 [Planctomycetes bacterium]|nr:hypothetical protein [Planctomycetota bacterium]